MTTVKSDTHEILFLPEVAARLRVSVGTVNRLLAKRRNGEGTFPLPLTGHKCKGRWRASDIDKYLESLAPVYTPSKVQQEHDFQQRQEAARAVLREHGLLRKKG